MLCASAWPDRYVRNFLKLTCTCILAFRTCLKFSVSKRFLVQAGYLCSNSEVSVELNLNFTRNDKRLSLRKQRIKRTVYVSCLQHPSYDFTTITTNLSQKWKIKKQTKTNITYAFSCWLLQQFPQSQKSTGQKADSCKLQITGRTLRGGRPQNNRILKSQPVLTSQKHPSVDESNDPGSTK